MSTLFSYFFPTKTTIILTCLANFISCQSLRGRYNLTDMDNLSANLLKLLETIRELRSDNGCPWDKKQTTKSLIKYLKEEGNEILDAIARNDKQNLCEELGDFLYLIIMVCEINREQGFFSLEDVMSSINKKLIRRHPHVFAGTEMKDEDQLRRQWEEIKRQEKKIMLATQEKKIID